MALEGLESLLKGLEDQASWQTQKQFRLVLTHWPKAVGFAVARKTRPVGIQRGTLYVATATAAWAQTLFYERFRVLEKLNRHQHQPLKGIRFSSAQWAQAQSPLRPNSQDIRHPSYLGNVPSGPQAKADADAEDDHAIAPLTPIAAFQRWAYAMQHLQTAQVLCPRCHCHCPPGELERWSICAVCAAKQWH
ncbi:MAG: DUF721 domain-containing protein [Phormidesmis sp. RL_2_1]|nr:DUF721 domain-containing protein [Phormidesmis sp. RL_2_1]